MPRKNPPDPPYYPLAEIQAAVRAKNYYFGKPARQRLAMGKWTVADAESWVEQLTSAHFHEAGVTTDPANRGQKFDVYKFPAEPGRTMYMKFELLENGAVEIISLHRTDK